MSTAHHGSSSVTPQLFADVAVEEPVEGLFTYIVPSDWADQIRIGHIVEVPFGSRIIKGCVVGLKNDHDHVPLKKNKPLRRIVNPAFCLSQNELALAQWLSEYYLAPIGSTLACISFIGFNEIAQRRQRCVRLAAPVAPAPKLTPKQQAVLEWLSGQNRPVPLSHVTTATGVGESVVERLIARGLLAEELVALERQDDYEKPSVADSALPLTQSQREAFEKIKSAIDEGKHHTFLLFGVTGSGKTEVYLQAIAHALDQGGSAIVLVPEIALTPQTVDRFRRRFGDLVGVYHSKLTLGQKYDLWLKIRDNRCRILVGARSAVFAPMNNLKILVVDEEHEPSYKQDTTPRYHARDVAILRGHRESAVVVLGSATPSVESYHKALQGKFELLTLPERIDGRPLPPITVIDLGEKVREDLAIGVFCPEVVEAMRSTLSCGEQVLVFLNRRGFFNFAICLECKTSLRCKYCDVAMTYHKVGDRLTCHYCGYSMKRPAKCPQCENTELSMVGIGTQRLEDELHQLFPEKTVLRVDLDTMRGRTAYLEAWQLISERKADIIVGTQMIARGIHLEAIGLVVVPLADVSLFQPDFRSAERAFSLLTQVAGRAGRGESHGKVIIQTYVPYHYAIRCAENHDYPAFFRQEIRIRKILRFPPFSRLVAFLGSAASLETGEELFQAFVEELKTRAYRHRESVAVLGPTPAPLSRLAGKYRWRALMRGTDAKFMRELTREALARFHRYPGHSHLDIVVDVDPYDLL
jgi:primosomal protein N' (replication factor Y)